MAEVDARGYATRRASGRLSTKARAQPCPLCGIVLAGDELLRHVDAKTARVYDAVVHVLPDAAKVLGAVAKLS